MMIKLFISLEARKRPEEWKLSVMYLLLDNEMRCVENKVLLGLFRNWLT
ncbi:hypothetical protein QU601_001928 [Orientia tsutsugamushi]|nr:hypothetical protein [Orientia tsutsugamushi]